LSLFCGVTLAQNTPLAAGSNSAPMRLVSSSSSKFINQKIFRSYNAVYEHNGSTLAADSGDFYKDDIGNEYFEAHGNILITQPSGSVIQGTHLHYDASSQHAVLTRNVKMVDGQTTLTTNYMTYNMRNQEGTYTGGGRIVGQGDTITSQKAYYFEKTKDSYFQKDVVVRTESAIILTDTLQYNTLYRDAIFHGPTNINGRKGEKLYTESGTYNTEFGIAKFNKNNLYTEGSRFLKGDSLFYDRDQGIGEAFKNVLFVDTLDKFYASGQYGKYLQSDQSILLRDKPLIKYVINTDSTKKAQDSLNTDSLNNNPQLSKKELKKQEKAQEKEREKLEKDLAKQEKEVNLVGTDSIPKTDSIPLVNNTSTSKIDTAYMTADTIFSKVILVKDYKPLNLKLDRNGGEIIDSKEIEYGDPEELELINTTDSTVIDSIPTVAKKEVLELKKTVEKPVEIAKKTPTAKPKPVDVASLQQINKSDSLLRQKAVIPTGKEADSLMNQAMDKALTADTLLKDSTQLYTDTAKTRIVRANYNVRVFKSDLQAVADSVYYGMVDSMFRFMGKPMLWSDGSQISSDTIYMQIKNGRMDNALLKDNAFMVNVVLDSLKFNQLKGRKITAFFANNNIDRVFVDGNAENLIFTSNEKTKKITEMFHDRSSRIKIWMEGKKIIDYVSERKVDQKLYPFKMVNQENEVLPGFIWKPEDRPKSLEDMMNRVRVKTAPVAEDKKEGDNPDVEVKQEAETQEGSKENKTLKLKEAN